MLLGCIGEEYKQNFGKKSFLGNIHLKEEDMGCQHDDEAQRNAF
jgi:hypothetical protein